MGFITLLLPLVSQLFDRIIPDPAQRAKEQAAFISQITTMASAQDAAQSNVNAVEAASPNIWVSGWRPLFGWVGGAAMAWAYLIKPMLVAFSGFLPEKVMTAILNAPALDDNFWSLIIGMLGLGGLRTYEKLKGVAQ